MRYEKYKQTGTKWITSIPVSWDMQKIGALFVQRKEKVSDKDFAPISVTKNGILPQLATAAKTDDGDNRKKVCVGDFVINSRSDRKGSCGVSDLEGSVSLINIVLQPREQLSGRYAHYLLRNHLFSEEYYRNGRGIVADLWTTRYSEMKTILLPVPPRAEQDQIVRYLDWQVSKINRLIAAKKRQLSILAEYRKAKIDEIILHGDKKAPQKDSGIWWLRDIPQSWQVIPLKRICQVNASISNTAKQLSDEELVTFLPMESVSTTGTVDHSEKRRLGDVRSGYSSFALNDVVIAKITPCFENGKGACLDSMDTDIGYGTTEFINLRASDRILPRYLYMITMTQPFRKLGEEMMTGSAGQKRVPIEFVKGFAVGIPPIEEQARLLALLNDVTKRIDCQTKSYYESIISLQELRTRLISDVVTGQIDVRGIEIPEFEYTADVVASEDESAEDMEPDAEEA